MIFVSFVLCILNFCCWMHAHLLFVIVVSFCKLTLLPVCSNPTFSLVIFLVQKFNLSDINTTTQDFHQGLHGMSLSILSFLSYHIIISEVNFLYRTNNGAILIHSVIFCHLIGVFRSFTFNVICNLFGFRSNISYLFSVCALCFLLSCLSEGYLNFLYFILIF